MPLTCSPFDPIATHAEGCACSVHGVAASQSSGEQRMGEIVRTAVLRAAFPKARSRRALLRAVGATALAGALADFFPLGMAEALAQDAPKNIEKPNLKIGFIPITCASPIIMAQPMGFYTKYGLNVDVIKTAGWAIVRDKALNHEYDASHMLSPMPIAISLGVGSVQQDWQIPAIENINGQAIVLASKHKDRRDPKTWKGMRFGSPFDFSMHNYLLRYYLAEAGLDPDTDVTIRVIPPPEMVANLRADNIDGFLGPDPVNQRAVFDGIGFIHILSRDIWDGHPCCAFGASKQFITQNPNTFLALSRAIIDATGYANKAENRKEIADAIAPANYLNQPPVVVEQALTGTFADGLGNIIRQPQRAGFDPFPWESFGVWILTQMQRWGQIKGDVDYATVARNVLLATDARREMTALGLIAPTSNTKTFVVMGKTFDPAKPAEYLASFPIRRS
jgi:nitrate/nitrite transport system substrate-binding protein